MSTGGSSDSRNPAMEWRLTLRDGTKLSIFADSTFTDENDQVFELAQGERRPPVLTEIARVPSDAIVRLVSEVNDEAGDV